VSNRHASIRKTHSRSRAAAQKFYLLVLSSPDDRPIQNAAPDRVKRTLADLSQRVPDETVSKTRASTTRSTKRYKSWLPPFAKPRRHKRRLSQPITKSNPSAQALDEANPLDFCEPPTGLATPHRVDTRSTPRPLKRALWLQRARIPDRVR
jgi:hypothetical protein